MLGNYKLPLFDVSQIQALAEGLQSAGVDVDVTWKKRNKALSDPADGANGVEFRLGDDWILRQNGPNGSVRLDKVPAQKQATFLRCLKEHEVYSTPKWGLGIGLFVVYWLILLLVMSAYPGWPATFLLIGGIATSVSLGILGLSTSTHVPAPVWWFFMIIGGLGYFATAIYSILAIGMIKTILVNNHYQNVTTIPGRQAASQ